YVLPRIIPTDGAVERNIEKLAEPRNLDGIRPLIADYEAWLVRVEKQPVEYGFDGQSADDQKSAERDKFLKDLAAWKSELGAIRCGLDILEKSRDHWSGPGDQKSPLGIPFEAWLSMNAAMTKVAKAKGYDE